MMIAIFIVAAVLLVTLGGLLAASEEALDVQSRSDIVDLANASSSGTRRSLLAISRDVGAHSNAVSFMRILSETTAAVLVSLSFAYSFGQWWLALLLSALIMTAVTFVLVGSSPRSVGRTHPRRILRFAAPIIRATRVILGPIAIALVAIGNWVTPGRPKSATFSSEEQLLSMVDAATELEVLDEDDRELIHSIFEFNDTVVREVMVPRTDMVSLEADAHLATAMSLFLSSGVSRMPVIGEDIDHVLGILYLRDVARLTHEATLDAETVTVAELARPALFVPESKKADDTLRQMQIESNHLAMVVDEYGGIAGLVTMEDLIEELVGDIADEYDREVPDFEQLEEGRFRVSARMSVDELGDLFSIELEDDEVDSVGGLLTKTLGRLPVAGSIVSVGGLILTAERTEGRRKRVITVLVERDEALISAQAAFNEELDQNGSGD